MENLWLFDYDTRIGNLVPVNYPRVYCIHALVAVPKSKRINTMFLYCDLYTRLIF